VSDRNTTSTARLAVVLAGVAGFLDVVGYVTLHHVFTAHMTGNTSKLGLTLGRAHAGAALPLAVVPFFFATGIAAGTVLVDLRRRWLALALQAALVAVYMVYGSSVVHDGSVPDHAAGGFYALAAVATVSLGLQTAALTQLQGETVRTSYISGVLTNLTQAGVRRLSGRGARKGRLLLLGAILGAYLAGAVLGGVMVGGTALWALALPLAVLVGAAGYDRHVDRRAVRSGASGASAPRPRPGSSSTGTL
jgi:uncharacterized membrane protein YoaK (UPF0700 family)